jgi:hypothetical protein
MRQARVQGRASKRICCANAFSCLLPLELSYPRTRGNAPEAVAKYVTVFTTYHVHIDSVVGIDTGPLIGMAAARPAYLPHQSNGCMWQAEA